MDTTDLNASCHSLGGGGGTPFLGGGNVVVRGPSPTGCTAHTKAKTNDQPDERKAAQDVFAAPACTFRENDAPRRISGVSALTASEGMDVDRADSSDDDDDDACSITTQDLDEDAMEEEPPAFKRTGSAFNGRSRLLQFAHPSQAQHLQATQNTFPSRAQDMRAHSTPPATSTIQRLRPASHAPSPAGTDSAHAHQDIKAYRAMHRILHLNQSAIEHSLSSGDTSSVLDALHQAEWTRCHLADELAAARMQSQDGAAAGTGMDASVVNGREAKMVRYSSDRGISSSFTHGSSQSLSEQGRATKSYKRSASLDNSTAMHRHLSLLEGNDIARTSYIYQRMDFDEGMHSFAGLEAIDPASFWTTESRCEINPAIEATLVFNMGQVHRRQGDLDAASRYYDRALSVLTGRNEVLLASQLEGMLCRHHIAIPILHNVGQLRYRRGDIGLALETYSWALCLARSMYGERHPHVASSLNCLGVLHYHDANGGDRDDEDEMRESPRDRGASTRRAMELFQQALALRLEVLGPNHVDVATVMNNIGRIHVQMDEFDKALGFYEDALRIRRTMLGADSLDYAATAFNAGQSFHQKGELERASELYHEFLRVALARFGHSHRDVAVVLSGIAQIHQEKREYQEALELYEASLCAGRAALGEDHSEIAMLLNRMGNFHFERERLDDALRCYRRGLRIERKMLPPDHPNIVVTLSNLGEIHRQRGEWEDAADMYGECLAILREKYDGDHVDVASTLSTVGLIHDQRGDACKSLRYLQDALLMRRRLLGNDHVDVGTTLVYIGTILYRRGVLSVALELFSESLRIRQAALGPDHRDVAFVLYNIALVHQQRGCYEEAVEAYSETLRIEKLALGEGHRDVSMTLFKLGEVHKAAGALGDAMECFKTSLAIERGLSSPDPAALARALNEIGNIHLLNNEVVPMMEALNEASRLYQEAGLSPNNVVVNEHLYAMEVSCPECAPAA